MANNLFIPYENNSPFTRGSALFEALTAPLGSAFTPESVDAANKERRLQRVQNVKNTVGSKLFDAMQNPTQLKKELWSTGNYTDLGEVNQIVEDLYASQNPRSGLFSHIPPQQQLADSSKTAGQAIAPPPEVVEKQKQQEAQAKETAKKNQQAEIANARTPSGASVQDIAALPLVEDKPKADTTSDQDLSKAMLRAGIAMMASKGDIWDALAAGFSGYQGSLDAEEEAKAKKAKEDREYALDKYKTDLYGMYVQAQIANSRRGGEKPPNLSQQAAYGNYMLRLQEYVTDRKDKLRETASDPMKSEQEHALALQELSKIEGQSDTPSFKK